MTGKLPLSAQARAIETIRNVISRGQVLKASERELMDERLAAVARTIAYLQRNEAEFRAFMANRAAEAEAKR